MPKWNDARITEIHDINPQLRIVKLSVMTEEIFEFKAGQFITFDLPIGDKRLDRWRSYSIANPPSNNNEVELCIARVPEGRATQFLFEEIKVDSVLKFKGPQGVFTLPDNMDQDIVMICTGTGVAPFRSMLQDIHRKRSNHRMIHLIYGTRYADSLLYFDEFKDLEQAMPGFRYHIALSRETYDDYQGYVHGIYEQLNLTQSTVRYYLCGWQQMIDESVERLTQNMGIDRSQIMYELYG